jgi:hypothetical protein
VITLTPAQRRLAKAMSEDGLQEAIRSRCVTLGLTAQHVYDARRCWLPGWPDLIIIGTSIIYRELKRMGEDPSADQRRVGRAIRDAGGSWGVWRPDHLLSGAIDDELAAIASLTERARA